MNTLGNHCTLTIFGQSHSAAIGGVLDGLPAGEKIDLDAVGAFLRRRAPGRNAMSTPRAESDAPEVLSGLVDGVTCGAPLAFLIRNHDARSQDYASLRDHPRPGHADFTAWAKNGAAHDIRGGGQFSGRLTAPLCFAGA
ncbi:MAG: chorismate synthase, partial [Planctomycetes bacterium]|nr:chorismate synthase [Planctomycetota bacterium]